MSVRIRPSTKNTIVDTEYSWLRFTDGAIVDGLRCPSGILVRNHWDFDGTDVRDAPNMVCRCPKETT